MDQFYLQRLIAVQYHNADIIQKQMGNSESKLLLIGLDNSGKTTILSRIVQPDRMNTQITPTVGYKKTKFSRNGIDFEVFDMAGQAKYRELWQQNANYQTNRIDGIIFVVDASDKMRLKVAKSQLQLILQNRAIPEKTPYLIYANKSDLKGASTPQEVQQIMDLKTINRQYRVFLCSGLTGKGIQQGVQWLSFYLKPIVQNR